MFKHILVPTDGSEISLKSSQSAINLAQEMGAKITGVYIKPTYPLFYFGEAAAFDNQAVEEFYELAEKHSIEYLHSMENICKEAKVEFVGISVENNSVYEGIINTAQKQNCDLIFMASHGRKGLVGLLLGSETQKVLTHSPVPVLVYR